MTEDQIEKEYTLIIRSLTPDENPSRETTKEEYVDPNFDEWDKVSEETGTIAEEIQ